MEQYIAFIKGDCNSIIATEDLEVLKAIFESYTWDDYDTFKLIIPFDPVYKMIQSSYRIPIVEESKDYRDQLHKLENYLPVATIETLSYFDYYGERTFGCIKHPLSDVEMEDTDFEVCDAKDLNKLMKGLRNYLEKNKLPENHERVKDIVGKLELMTEVAQKYQLEILLFDEYF